MKTSLVTLAALLMLCSCNDKQAQSGVGQSTNVMRTHGFDEVHTPKEATITAPISKTVTTTISCGPNGSTETSCEDGHCVTKHSPPVGLSDAQMSMNISIDLTEASDVRELSDHVTVTNADGMIDATYKDGDEWLKVVIQNSEASVTGNLVIDQQPIKITEKDQLCTSTTKPFEDNQALQILYVTCKVPTGKIKIETMFPKISESKKYSTRPSFD